jgi:hypothetical protein
MAAYREMAYVSTKPRYVLIFRRMGNSLGTFGQYYRVETVDMMNIVPAPPDDDILTLKESNASNPRY